VSGPGSSRLFAAANLVAALVFSLSALVQFNDPDPARWIALYGSAAVVCLAALRRWRAAPALALAVALVALGWAAALRGVLRRIVFSDLFRAMKAETPAIEESREFLGLLIVAGWMIALAAVASRPSWSGRSDRGYHS